VVSELGFTMTLMDHKPLWGLSASHGCRVCDGTTFIIDEATGDARPCECRDARIKATRLRGARTSLPRLYVENGADLEREPVLSLAPKLKSTVQGYGRRVGEHLDRGEGLWFHGPHGTFKTSAAVAIAKEAERQGYSVGFRTVPELLWRLRSTHDEGSVDSYERLLDKLVQLDLLVLDDFGAERTTEYALEALYAIVNKRLLDKRAILVTTNLEPDDLADQVGERIVSRLYEVCGHPLNFLGSDSRREHARSAA
jgi:DNA replication protein DnaC